MVQYVSQKYIYTFPVSSFNVTVRLKTS